MANLLAAQIAKIDNRAKFGKHGQESIKIFPPVDHGTRHRRSLSSVLSVDEELQPRIIKKANARSLAKNVVLPVPGICRNGHKGKNFRIKLLVRSGALTQPCFDRGPPLLIESVGRIDIDCGEIPTLAESITFGESIFGFSVDNGVLVGTWVEVDKSVKAFADGIDVLLGRSPFLTDGVDCAARGHECISSQFFDFNVSNSSRRTASGFFAGAIMLNQPSITFILVEKYDWSMASAARAILTFVN